MWQHRKLDLYFLVTSEDILIIDWCGIWCWISEHLEFKLYPVSDKIYSIYVRAPCWTNTFITKIEWLFTCIRLIGFSEGVFRSFFWCNLFVELFHYPMDSLSFVHIINFMNSPYLILPIYINCINEQCKPPVALFCLWYVQ